jgi:hypothetical protein
LNEYTVAVRATLPQDFSAWATSNAIQIDYRTENASTAESAISYAVYLSSDSTTAVSALSADAANTSWTTASIDDSVLDDASAPEWDAAGETAIIYVRMRSRNDNYVRLGDIRLNYLARY